MRADAVRNRSALLEAAGKLFDRAEDPAFVTMEDVAREAGVGKGTLFRRYETKSNLLQAVFAERVTALKKEIISEDSPLGPHTPPLARLKAVMQAIIAFKIDNFGISHALETSDGEKGSRPFLSTSAYRWAHELFSTIICDISDVDSSFRAHALLGLTRMDSLRQLIEEEQGDVSMIQVRVERYIEALFANHTGL